MFRPHLPLTEIDEPNYNFISSLPLALCGSVLLSPDILPLESPVLSLVEPIHALLAAFSVIDHRLGPLLRRYYSRLCRLRQLEPAHGPSQPRSEPQSASGIPSTQLDRDGSDSTVATAPSETTLVGEDSEQVMSWQGDEVSPVEYEDVNASFHQSIDLATIPPRKRKRPECQTDELELSTGLAVDAYHSTKPGTTLELKNRGNGTPSVYEFGMALCQRKGHMNQCEYPRLGLLPQTYCSSCGAYHMPKKQVAIFVSYGRDLAHISPYDTGNCPSDIAFAVDSLEQRVSFAAMCCRNRSRNIPMVALYGQMG